MDIMNEVVLGLDIPSPDLYSESFNEFCEFVDFMDYLLEDGSYFEAVVDPKVNVFKKTGRMIGDAGRNARKVGAVYGDVVTSKANIYKIEFNAAVTLVGYIARLTKFVSNFLLNAASAINKVVKRIEKIPINIMTEIRGDINIYITVPDIQMLYNKVLFSRIDQYLSNANLLAEGDFWDYVLVQGVSDSPVLVKGKTICKHMAGVYKDIRNVRFSQQVVKMKDQQTISIYFGNDKVLKFKDLHGRLHECTYYEALLQLVEDLKTEHVKLNAVSDTLSDKFNKSMQNQNFGKLNPRMQSLVMDTIQQTSKVANIVASILKCVMSDIKSVDSAIDTILKRGKVSIDNKDANTASDAAKKVAKESKKVTKSKEKKNEKKDN